MAKYLVETYYTCSFKVKHYLDELNEDQLQLMYFQLNSFVSFKSEIANTFEKGLSCHPNI